MGGPGETQIETDRRLLADKIGKLKKPSSLEVRRTRDPAAQRPASARLIRPWLWWATPTPASRLCSTA
jgi:GTP-binding protein HflX